MVISIRSLIHLIIIRVIRAIGVIRVRVVIRPQTDFDQVGGQEVFGVAVVIVHPPQMWVLAVPLLVPITHTSHATHIYHMYHGT